MSATARLQPPAVTCSKTPCCDVFGTSSSRTMASLKKLVEKMVNVSDDEGKPRKNVAKKKKEQIESAWKRIFLSLVMMMNTARQQSVMDYIAKKSMIAENDVPQKTASKAKSKAKKGTPIIQGIGLPLPRSQAQKTWREDSRSCAHPAEYLRCRANRFDKRWICLECGSRWQRLQEPTNAASASSKDVPDFHDAQPLKEPRTGKTYPQFLPAPRSRPLQGNLMLTKESDGQLNYVRDKFATTDPKYQDKMPAEGSASRSTSKTRKKTSGLRAHQRPKTPKGHRIHFEGQELVLSEASWSNVEMPNNRQVEEVD